MRSTYRFVLVLLASAVLAGCASTRAPDPRDPWEPMNRATYEFNDALDRAVFKPVAQGYRAALPSPVRTGVRNFFSNLQDPWIAVNQLLQGKVDDALSDLWRFIANTTFGIGGIFDIATDMRMTKHNEDFGQTLAVWGLDFGPYFVLPLLGPSTVRDAAGRGVDSYAYLPWVGPEWLDLEHRVAWRSSLTGLDYTQTRANLLDASTTLEQAALDRYAFVRNAYFQRRRNLIYDGNPPPERGTDKQSLDEQVDPDSDTVRESTAPAPRSEVQQPLPAPVNAVEPKVPANYSSVLEAGAQPVPAR